VDARFRPSQFIDGRFTGVKVILSNITKQKIAEETAKENEAARVLAEEGIKRKNDELNARMRSSRP